MLKKLVAGDYSLKLTFWIFGVLGFSLFYVIAGITRTSLVGAARISGTEIGVVIKYILNRSVSLMLGNVSGNVMPYIVMHLITGAVFVVYMYLVLRGLWKSGDKYEGGKFWVWSAKAVLVAMALWYLKSVI